MDEEIMKGKQEYIFRSMQLEDIPQICEVEVEAFTTPWTYQAFRNELLNNHNAHYIVVERGEEIVGYAGMWMIVDEAHITNIALRERYRKQGLGKQLFSRLIDAAALLGAERMTLEVRVSNYAAQGLYEQFGFRPVGVRKGYYSDNQEDALIMWAEIQGGVGDWLL